jgi:5-methylcytosine-specific restriction protein A
VPKRECLTCRVLHDGPGSRCPRHTRAREQVRDRARGTAAQRGYDYTWQQLSALVVAHYKQCMSCGDTGTLGNPLTADHIIPKSRGGTDDWANLTCLCRECNSRKGSQAR